MSDGIADMMVILLGDVAPIFAVYLTLVNTQ